MKLFFRTRIPDHDYLVLVESGPRHLLENLIPKLYREHGEGIRIDLVTCYAGLPAGFRPEQGRVYRTQDFRGWEGAKKVAKDLAYQRAPVLGIICAGVPVMSKWKWLLAATMPSKLFVLNENGDYFWVDYSNWRLILHFMAFRAGMTEDNSVLLPLRALLYPFGMLYLALYAVGMHARRWSRNPWRRRSA